MGINHGRFDFFVPKQLIYSAAQQWLEKQKVLLLPAPYFMLTFTLPEGLRRVARSHQKLF